MHVRLNLKQVSSCFKEELHYVSLIFAELGVQLKSGLFLVVLGHLSIFVDYFFNRIGVD